MNFENKRVIVTGAGSGFGAATAKLLAANGAKVIASDINLAGAEDTVGIIQQAGGTAKPIRTDVREASDMEAMVNLAISEFGGLDIVINNAGLGHKAVPMHELSEADYDLVFNTNTKSIFWSVKYSVPELIKSGGGVIVNVASIGAKRPRPLGVAYNGSKGAVATMTRALASELARHKIRVNAVCPLASETGFFKTTGVDKLSDKLRDHMIKEVPLRRLTDPSDVANSIAFLASEQATFLTGILLDVDGGKGI
ncbi:MAG: glucose 1-dehydrogenase [Pseudomonadales bacterium]|nr:glucose 1-dehydrogenase [Pseudomonadales bacterium]